jgi:hypothetical protein
VKSALLRDPEIRYTLCAVLVRTAHFAYDYSHLHGPDSQDPAH